MKAPSAEVGSQFLKHILDRRLLNPQALCEVVHHLAQALSQLHLWLPPQHLLGLQHPTRSVSSMALTVPRPVPAQALQVLLLMH